MNICRSNSNLTVYQELLNLIGYFEEKPIHDWSLDSFDEEYLERSKITKDISHYHFFTGLRSLRDAFPDDTEMIRTIASLEKSLSVRKTTVFPN